jgi:hypothetical protein
MFTACALNAFSWLVMTGMVLGGLGLGLLAIGACLASGCRERAYEHLEGMEYEGRE